MMSAQVIIKLAKSRMGFLQDTDIPILAADPTTRLTLCLVRCGQGRFIAPVQDVAHFIDIIESAQTSEYVRDVSLWEAK